MVVVQARLRHTCFSQREGHAGVASGAPRTTLGAEKNVIGQHLVTDDSNQ